MTNPNINGKLVLSEAQLAEIRERKENALDIVYRLSKARGSAGSIEWVMSIPAQPDRDPDIVIARSLRDIDDMSDTIDALTSTLAVTRRALELATGEISIYDPDMSAYPTYYIDKAAAELEAKEGTK